jgi:hypothetical protein
MPHYESITDAYSSILTNYILTTQMTLLLAYSYQLAFAVVSDIAFIPFANTAHILLLHLCQEITLRFMTPGLF